MSKSLLLAAALLPAFAFAQTPPAPAPAPAADPDLVEPDPEMPKAMVQMLETGSFERPRIKARTARSDGGDPTRTAQREWLRFQTPQLAEGEGKLSAGLTNELARTGKQSLFIDFDKVTKPQASAALASKLLSVQPGKDYRIAIWGRLDKKRPLTIDQRIPFLGLEVEFFTADRETQADESIQKVQPMPGSKNRPLVFTAGKWSPFYFDVETPAETAFLRVTWTWTTPLEKGATSGVIYFDDATVEGPPGKSEEELMNEAPEPTDEPEEGGTAPAPAPAAPVATPAPRALATPVPRALATPVPRPAATPAPAVPANFATPKPIPMKKR